MGTAVLHPQDYLAGSQNDRNRHFCISECPSSIARPGGRAFSTTHDRSVPLEGSTIPNRGRGLLGRRGSSPGLLPLPDQALQNAHNSYSRLTPKIAASRLGEFANSSGSKHFASSHHSNFSSYVSEMCPSRRSVVPMLGRAHSSLSECFPLHGVQLHDTRPLHRDARFFLDSSQGKCMNASPSCAGRTAMSCQKLEFFANSHFSDSFNPAHPNWVDSIDQSVPNRKRMHPELCQVEVYLGRQCEKPPSKVLPDGQGQSICTKMNTVGRNFGVNKQLKRSVSDILQRPATKEVSRKLTTRMSEGVAGSHTGACSNSKIEVKFVSPAPSTSYLEEKTEKGPQLQVSLDVDTQGRLCLHGQCYGSANAALEHKTVNAAKHKDVKIVDQMIDVAGCASEGQYDICKVDGTSTSGNESAVNNMRKYSTVVGSEGISRSGSSVFDNDETWVSMVNDERWAGPSFFNSPSPSSLPVPSFTLLFSRTGSKPQAKHTRDVAFATKDLRRMLHLDHASCDL